MYSEIDKSSQVKNFTLGYDTLSRLILHSYIPLSHHNIKAEVSVEGIFDYIKIRE